MEVVLLDAFGRSVHREMEVTLSFICYGFFSQILVVLITSSRFESFQVVASLLYADSGTHVEKTRDDAEAPLLTSCDGLEYPSTSKPVMLLRGRATFKLKISQVRTKVAKFPSH